MNKSQCKREQCHFMLNNYLYI
ncbi:hypothetical protein EZS27_011035, partial [termite gut metagenome]